MVLILILFAVGNVLMAWGAVRLRARRRTKKDLCRLAHFAMANDLSYAPALHDGRYLRPWAERGTLRVMDTIGTRQGRPLEFGNYELITGGAGSRNTTLGG